MCLVRHEMTITQYGTRIRLNSNEMISSYRLTCDTMARRPCLKRIYGLRLDHYRVICSFRLDADEMILAVV